MSTTYPGTTVEVRKIEKGSSRQLFDGLFAAGGITLSQVSVMTNLEPYMIQNWVKRGFVTSPVKRQYSRAQFARIVIINMLKETLQIEHICDLWRVIGGATSAASDDLIADDELYHLYVDMIAQSEPNLNEPQAISEAASRAVGELAEREPVSAKKLARILEVMLYAHAACRLRQTAEEILSTLD